jgi:hypothetical protein
MVQITHTLTSVGKTYTFDIGGGGCDKRTTRTPTILEKDHITIYCYGQDSTSIYKDDTQLILTLADGHGPKHSGNAISYRLHELIINCLLDIKDFLVSNLKLGKYDTIKSTLDTIFNEVNDTILYSDQLTSHYNSGGSTFVLVHKIIDEETGDLYTISSNVGDSSYMTVNSDEVTELSHDQNCDNMVAVTQYYNYCLDNGVEPSRIIFGRFNTPKGFKTPWIGDQPIEPYICTKENGKYILSQNTTAMKQIYELAPDYLKSNTFYNGGPQSIRCRPKNLEALANGQFPMENYGSTINGDLQMVSSFGDKASKIKHNIMCRPHTHISTNTNEHEFISSDGPMDCLTNNEIIKLFYYKKTTSMSMELFCEFLEKSIDIQAAIGGFSFMDCLPAWDDLSYWVVETKVNESLQYRIRKLEEQNKLLLDYANQIKDTIKTTNIMLDTL